MHVLWIGTYHLSPFSAHAAPYLGSVNGKWYCSVGEWPVDGPAARGVIPGVLHWLPRSKKGLELTFAAVKWAVHVWGLEKIFLHECLQCSACVETACAAGLHFSLGLLHRVTSQEVSDSSTLSLCIPQNMGEGNCSEMSNSWLVIASLNSFHCSYRQAGYCSSYTRHNNLPDMHNCACTVHTLHALCAAQFQMLVTMHMYIMNTVYICTVCTDVHIILCIHRTQWHT